MVRHFPPVQRIGPDIQKIPYRNAKPHDAGKIGGAGLVAVRQGRGHFQGGGHTAGAAGKQWGHGGVHGLVHHKAADTGGPQQPFMAGKAHGVHLLHLHIKEKMPCGLCGIHCEQSAVPAADLADAGDGLDGAADVAGILHDHQTGLGGKQLFKFLQTQKALLITGGDGNADPCRLQLGSRSCHGIVLHAADDEMIAGVQRPLHDHIQAHGDTAGKDSVAGIAAGAEQCAKILPYRKGGKGRFGSGPVAGAVDVDTDLFDIVFHGLANPRRFGEAGRTVIQIDLFHRGLRSSFSGLLLEITALL